MHSYLVHTISYRMCVQNVDSVSKMCFTCILKPCKAENDKHMYVHLTERDREKNINKQHYIRGCHSYYVFNLPMDNLIFLMTFVFYV